MRTGEIKRRTNETDVALKLEVDGQGRFAGQTGVGFLDHILALFAGHGLFEALLLLPHKIRAKQKEQHPIRCCSWCDREDSNLWPSGSEPNALSS